MGAPPVPGAGYMKGSIHFDKKANRWFVSIYWEGRRYRIFKHPQTLEPFWHRKSAEKQLHRIQTEVDDGTFHPKFWMPDSPLLLGNYVDQWLGLCTASKKTITDYRGYFKNHILPFFGDKKDIRTIRYSDILAFKKHMSAHRSEKTVYNVISCLRTLLHHAHRAEDIAKIPPFPVLEYELPEIEYLTMDQQDRVMAEIPEDDRPIFDFMMEYGVRPGEARALQKDCIRGDLVIIRRAFSDNTLRERTKTGQIRIYPLTDYFRQVLDDMPKHLGPFVFVRSDGKPYTSKNLNATWKAACEKTNIRIKMYNAFRHSLGCQLLDQGEDMDLVRQQLGHTKSEMTRRYARRSPAKLKEALSRRRNRKTAINPLKKPSQ